MPVYFITSLHFSATPLPSDHPPTKRTTPHLVSIPNSAHQFFAGGRWARPHFCNSSVRPFSDISLASELEKGCHISKSTRPLGGSEISMLRCPGGEVTRRTISPSLDPTLHSEALCRRARRLASLLPYHPSPLASHHKPNQL
jgi:hypothetical protein